MGRHGTRLFDDERVRLDRLTVGQLRRRAGRRRWARRWRGESCRQASPRAKAPAVRSCLMTRSALQALPPAPGSRTPQSRERPLATPLPRPLAPGRLPWPPSSYTVPVGHTPGGVVCGAAGPGPGVGPGAETAIPRRTRRRCPGRRRPIEVLECHRSNEGDRGTPPPVVRPHVNSVRRAVLQELADRR